MSLEKMTKEQLIKYAAQKGFALDAKLGKEEMVRLIKEAEEKVKAEQINSTEKTVKRWCKKQNDTTMTIKFQNLDSPGAMHSFTLDIGGRKKTKKGIKVTSDRYSFCLYDGEIYDLPLKIIEHLNNLQTRHDTVLRDPKTGFPRHKKGYKSRFACMPLKFAPQS